MIKTKTQRYNPGQQSKTIFILEKNRGLLDELLSYIIQLADLIEPLEHHLVVNSKVSYPDIITSMIVISDMMGTLTTGSPILGLLDWIKLHQSQGQARWLLASMMPSYLLVKLGLIDPQPWGQRLMIKSLTWLKDMDEQKFAQACEWAVEQNLWRKRREDVIARLQEHTQHGAQVYLASSVVEPIAEAFARRIGVLAIGSPVTIEGGKVRLVDGLVSSERKIQEVLQRLQVEQVDYAYGDTFMDIPLLENAMHPDMRLEKVARERGWEIVGQR